MIIAKECLLKGKQLLLFLLLRKQGKPEYTMMICTVHMYYSENRTSGVECFEMVNIYGNCKGMPVQRKPTPHVPPPKKAR